MDLLTFESYLRNKAKELDEEGVSSEIIKKDINYAQWKVQQDIIPLGLSTFTKVAYLTGNTSAVPDDLLATSDAIEYIYASTGSVVSVDTDYGSNADLTFTTREPGVSVRVEYEFQTPLGAVTHTIPTDVSPYYVIHVNLSSGVSTGLLAKQYLEADYRAMELISVALASGSDGTGTISSAPPDQFILDGEGSRWRKCKAVSIADANNLNEPGREDYFGKATANKPQFVRQGNASAVQTLRFFPEDITSAKMWYYYRFPEMVEDTDTLTIPNEFEELVTLAALTKVYETLNRMTEEKKEKVKYQTLVAEYESAYKKTLISKAEKDGRLNANDQK